MKALVLFSGGLDSTTCLAMAVEKYGFKNVTALSMYYGQKHDKEVKCAEDIVRYYKVKHLEYDLTPIFEGSECSLLKRSDNDVPEGTYSEQKKESGTVSTYVPFRNGLFLSVATSVALINNIEVIYYGIHSDDITEDAYPDCSPAFNDAMNKAVYLGTGKSVQIFAPFVGKRKADIVAEGLRLKVPYEKTWSCYEGGDKPCGKCATCIDRQRAFEVNGAIDPLYEH